jgi:hypothetical protein
VSVERWMTAKKKTQPGVVLGICLSTCQCSKNFALLVENTNYVPSLSDINAVELMKRMRWMVSD